MNASAPISDEEAQTHHTQANTLANSRRSISSSFRKILLPGPVPLQPRRSIAHRRSLLGYDEHDDNEGVASSSTPTIQETSTDWHDVELEFDVEMEGTTSSSRTHTRRESIPLKPLEYQYRVDDDEEKVFNYGARDDQYDEEDEDEDEEDGEQEPLPVVPQQHTSAYTRLTAPYHDEDQGITTTPKLDFESLTLSEKISYWVTAVLVLALSIVAIGIGSDWIDWPGDGIGKD